MKKVKIKSIISRIGLAVLITIITFLLVFGMIKMMGQKPVKASNSSNTSDVQLLARAINGEARGEPYEGQVAVGAVILNRVKDPKFPNTIAGVIYQSGAFTAVADGQINVPIEEGATVVKAARDALNGWDPTDGAIYYFNPATATNKWIWSRPLIKTIGKHRFCR
ncbi:MAG: spore cortex-lytic enzyme SleB [Clostridia bacterium]|nr:spore cortex-lytic enzyme SleB [Clostridia bacterium]